MLRRLDEEEKKVEKPILCENKLEELESVMKEIIGFEQLIRVSYCQHKRIDKLSLKQDNNLTL